MAFDPTKPADNAQIVGQVFRDQYNALKAQIDAQQLQITALQTQLAQKVTIAQVNTAIAANSANNMDSFSASSDDISDPPQKNEVEDIQSLLLALIGALKH